MSFLQYCTGWSIGFRLFILLLRESELQADKAFQQHQVCETLLYGIHDSTKTINKLKTHAGPQGLLKQFQRLNLEKSRESLPTDCLEKCKRRNKYKKTCHKQSMRSAWPSLCHRSRSSAHSTTSLPTRASLRLCSGSNCFSKEVL